MKTSIRAEVVEIVREWWAGNARDLPWRHSRDPWEILVSETMAQQTQVGRVIPAWKQFLDRFPTATATAEASVGDVIALWDGLGYNRRAVLLHRCAVTIADEHDGSVPATLDALLDLPGVGPYTARAVLAFAFEEDVAVVDTNVGRVLARIDGRTLGGRDVQALAESLVPAGAGWEWNQALLDFGAEICTKRAPRCSSCPIAEQCSWSGCGEDPATGSAAVRGGQSAFAGSDREGRGRLVGALRQRPVDRSELALVMGWPEEPERAAMVAATVVADGLAVEENGMHRLP